MDSNLGQVVLVKDINPNFFDTYDGYTSTSIPASSLSYPFNLTEFNDKLYFTADDGESGRELFVSDGTTDGTNLVADLRPGSNNSYIYGGSPNELIVAGDKLFFVASNGESGRELFISDGTAAGTKLLADINTQIRNYPSYDGSGYGSDPSNFIAFQDRIYFTADNRVNGNELWTSDGTPEGTQLVADINSSSDGSFASNLTEFNDKLYFTANNGESGNELWTSDGTAEGTELILDINPGLNDYGSPNGSYADSLTEFGGRLYFTADDGKSGRELFVSDGTAGGTSLLVDLNPGLNNYGSPNSSSPYNFIEFNNKLYFSANNTESGNELWVTDGTAEGTQLVVDIRPGSSSYGFAYGSYPSNFIEFDNNLYFSANDGENGNELWLTDGTVEGTQLVADLSSGKSDYLDDGSYPSDLVEFNNRLYFSARNDENGRELFATDGTAEGTQLVADINPGITDSGYYAYPNDSGVSNLTVVGEELFFIADNGDTGVELFKLTADDLADSSNTSDQLLKENIEPVEDLSGQDTAIDNSEDNISTTNSGDRSNDSLITGDSNEILPGESSNDILVTGESHSTDTVIDFDIGSPETPHIVSERQRLASSLPSSETISAGEEDLANLNGIDTENLIASNFEFV